MTKLEAVAPLFARRARRALSAFDFKGRKLEQLTEIAEKGYIERNGAYYTISTGDKLLPDCKKSDVKISRLSLPTDAEQATR